jgi:hypothetical protein
MNWVWDPSHPKFQKAWNTKYKAKFPRRCKTSKIIINNKEEMRQHQRDYICISHLRTSPLWGYYDSDHWEDVD